MADTSKRDAASHRGRRDDGGRSRVTAVARLLLAVWLLGSASMTLADPPGAAAQQGGAVGVLLPMAGLRFALGLFLLSGFMSRITGLVLAGLGAWEATNVGFGIGPLALVVGGAYLVLRGGGAWAMDVYVQMMQDRLRAREARERAARAEVSEGPATAP